MTVMQALEDEVKAHKDTDAKLKKQLRDLQIQHDREFSVAEAKHQGALQDELDAHEVTRQQKAAAQPVMLQADDDDDDEYEIPDITSAKTDRAMRVNEGKTRNACMMGLGL